MDNKITVGENIMDIIESIVNSFLEPYMIDEDI
jgi:hypothetical protein